MTINPSTWIRRNSYQCTKCGSFHKNTEDCGHDPDYPCQLCGNGVGWLSTSGPEVCSSCACGMTVDDEIITRAKLGVIGATGDRNILTHPRVDDQDDRCDCNGGYGHGCVKCSLSPEEIAQLKQFKSYDSIMARRQERSSDKDLFKPLLAAAVDVQSETITLLKSENEKLRKSNASVLDAYNAVARERTVLEEKNNKLKESVIQAAIPSGQLAMGLLKGDVADALKSLGGDLSHNNVAEAKRILKDALK